MNLQEKLDALTPEQCEEARNLKAPEDTVV